MMVIQKLLLKLLPEMEKLTKSYSVIIKREDAEDQKMVQVNFSLVGDEKHGKDAHTWRRFWLNQVKCSISEGSTAKYVTEMMLLNNDIPFSIRNGNYVTEINGLKEFDNGPDFTDGCMQ